MCEGWYEIMAEKTLDISTVKGARANIKDLVTYGDGDTFRLLCKASSQEEGWMKSTKVCNVYNGCIVQVTTQQKNPDGSYAVAEALTFIPNCAIDIEANPRRIIPNSDTFMYLSKKEYEDFRKYQATVFEQQLTQS